MEYDTHQNHLQYMTVKTNSARPHQECETKTETKTTIFGLETRPWYGLGPYSCHTELSYYEDYKIAVVNSMCISKF